MRASVGDCRVYIDVDGPSLVADGPGWRQRPTMLLHPGGPGGSHATLKPHLDPLADVAQLVYLDPRGTGRSDRSTPDRWSFDQFADDLVALCDSLEIERPIVYGESAGAMVALRYAIRHPDHATKVILDSVSARFDLPAILEVNERLGGSEARAVAERYWSSGTTEGVEDFYRVCMPLYMQHTDVTPDFIARFGEGANLEQTAHVFSSDARTRDERPFLDEIRCPVLILAGRHDPATPAAGAEEIAEGLGDLAQLCVFDCGHGVARELPQQVLSVIAEFIA